jgi:hypothetical protein
MFTKLSVMAAVAAASATLCLGAGTAQADVWANPNSAPGGVDVWVGSGPGPQGPPMSGWCTYTSVVQGNPWGKPAPAFNVPFFLPEDGPARLWFPSYPTGSTWDITVTCPGPGGGEARITERTTTVW